MSETPFVAIDGALLTADGAFIGAQTVDDFERGNLNPYRDIGGFSISTNRHSEGGHSLRADGGGGEKSIASDVGDGLPYYPSRGDTVRFDVQFDTTGSSRVRTNIFLEPGGIYGAAYALIFDLGSGVLDLDVSEGGSRTNLDQTSVNFPSDSWDTVTWDTSSSGMTVEYRGNTLSTNHTSGRDSGGISFNTYGPRAWWDNIRAV